MYLPRIGFVIACIFPGKLTQRYTTHKKSQRPPVGTAANTLSNTRLAKDD